MNNGEIVVNAKNINIENSEIKNNSTWSLQKQNGIELSAEKNILIENSSVEASTLSDKYRLDINLKGSSLELNNSNISITDEKKGEVAHINLKFPDKINLNNSQILSIGIATLTKDTNGNNIIVESNELSLQDSIIGGYVDGVGDKGVTKLHITKDISLSDSFISGLSQTIKNNNKIIIDDTFNDQIDLGQKNEITINSELGEIRGGNLFYSFQDFRLDGGRILNFVVPENIKNIFIRITGGEKSLINGKIISSNRNSEITFINKHGFTIGPDLSIEKFKGIRLASLKELYFEDGTSFSSVKTEKTNIGASKAKYEIESDQLSGKIKFIGSVLKDNYQVSNIFQRNKAASALSTIDNVWVRLGHHSEKDLDKALKTVNPSDIKTFLDNSESIAFFYLSDSELRSIGFSPIDIRNVKTIKRNRVILGNLIKGVSDEIDNVTLGSDISLISDEIELFGSGISTYSGADVNVIANELNIRKKSGLWTVSPNDAQGGNINIHADQIILDGEITTASINGPAGDIFINANNLDHRGARFRSEFLWLYGSDENWKY